MKKIIIITLFFLSLTSTIITIPFAYGASPTPTKSTPTPTPKESLTEKISQLKDRIASRVTELKLVEKRGIIGTVEESSETKIKLTDIQGNTQFVDVDEITKFSSDSAKDSVGISDIKKGATISVIGLYNKESKRMLARFVNEEKLPVFAKGTISEIDKKNFTVTIKKDDGKEMLIDIANSTKLLQVTQDGEIVKHTFSKLVQDDIVFVASHPDEKKDDLFSATRFLVLTPLLKTEAKETVTPAIKKITPTPTAKPTKTPTPAE